MSQEQIGNTISQIAGTNTIILDDLILSRAFAKVTLAATEFDDYAHYTTRMNGVVDEIYTLLNMRQYKEAETKLRSFIGTGINLLETISNMRSKHEQLEKDHASVRAIRVSEVTT